MRNFLSLFVALPAFALMACASTTRNLPEGVDMQRATPQSTPPLAEAAAQIDVSDDFELWRHSEQTPVLSAADLVDASLLSGEFHQINPRVPVSGSMAVFTLHTPFGRMDVESVELLAVRIDELAAIDRLSRQSGFRNFTDAAEAAASRTGEALMNVVRDPVETVKGLPSGIARLVKRTYRSTRRTTLDVSDAVREETARRREDGENPQAESIAQSAQSTEPDEKTDDGSLRDNNLYREGERATLRYIGYNSARRDLAQRLQVDPNTTNPLLNAQMDELAWSGLLGRVSFSSILGSAGAIAEAASVSGRLNRLVWELSPEEIRDRNESELAKLGFAGIRVREFLRNGHFHPSLEIALTDSLVALNQAKGRWEVIDLAAEVGTEVEARFLVNTLRMAVAVQQQRSQPITRISMDDGVIWVDTADATRTVLAPVDHLSLTEWAEDMIRHPALAQRSPQLRVAGSVSEPARQALTRAGWRVQAFSPFPEAPPYRDPR